ncbi:MAG: pyridoxal-dependent decarboxylase [Deinococcales bacterium]
MTPEEFRRLGHELIDWIADFRTHERERPVVASVKPGDIRSQLPVSPPPQPQDLGRAFSELGSLLETGTLKWQHPRFFGYFPANADLSSVLGDLVSSGLGQLGLNWEASPALTELEEHTLNWMRELFGLPATFSGVIQDTASTSTLIALITARERSSEYAQYGGGLQAGNNPLIVYCSEQSHSSVLKAALLAGFGQSNVRVIQTDDRFAMRAELLEAAIRDDESDGRVPCAVVATFGTTGTTAIDPLDDIAGLARAHGLWLHVDAAMAGAALMLPECRALAHGIEAADSVVINAHKWIGAVFDCSLFFTRHRDHLVRVMSTNPSYLRTAMDERATNYRDWGIALGRRFRALKLWFLLYSEGVEGIRSRLRRDLNNAAWLARQVATTSDWELVTTPQFQTVCVRHVAPGMSPDEANTHNRSWVANVNGSGGAFLTPALIDGSWIARVSIGSLTTELEDVRELWQLMRREAEGDAR